MRKELKKAMGQYLSKVESKKNKKRDQLWHSEWIPWPVVFRRIPKLLSQTNNNVSIVAPPLAPVWSKLLKFAVSNYYKEPELFLLNYIKSQVIAFDWEHDLTIDKMIHYWPGNSFEASLYGGGTVYYKDKDPDRLQEILLKEKKQLEELSCPDFFKSGLMPLVHRFYEETNNLLAGTGCNIFFPHIIRGTFGIALQLRGFNNLLLDLIDDPEWVHKLMRFLADSHKKWYKDRANFLGEPIPKVMLYNDEVDCNVIGPNIYKEFILPYEIELSKFHGGVSYWHSCGNITPILELIRQIPGLEMLNISAWTDYKKAAEICSDIPLEICLDAVSDVYQADYSQMRFKINDILTICASSDVKAYTIHLLGISPYFKSIDDDLYRLKQWLKIAKELAKK